MSEPKKRKLATLKKLPNNPRQIKKEDFERLKQSIRNNPDYFEARPIILSDRTGELVVIAGNQRYEAAKALGMDEAPTYLLSGLTEEREREIIIRDNVENGEWDTESLANQFDIEWLRDMGVDLDFERIESEEQEALEEEQPEAVVVVVGVSEPEKQKMIELYGLEQIDATDTTRKLAGKQDKFYRFTE